MLEVSRLGIEVLERADVVVAVVVHVADGAHVLGEFAHDFLDIETGLEAEDILGLVAADLVVAEILDVLDRDACIDAEELLDAVLYVVRIILKQKADYAASGAIGMRSVRPGSANTCAAQSG